MPRLIAADDSTSVELGALIEELETSRFDPRDEDQFASYGSLIKRLANNRHFLGDIVVKELKDRCVNQVTNNQYSPQVILLHVGDGYIMRANFWPAMHDSVVVNSGAAPFFYGVAHDHNFSFLTVGYMGPGYWSEYYEFDYDGVEGYTGEAVDLRFVEKTKLDPGKVMLYRAHKDVHLQLPADEMSISLNIVEASHSVPFRDQYRFDVRAKTIEGVISVLSLEQLLAVSAQLGGDNGTDLLDDFAARHPNDRVRFHALKARASALTDIDARLALYDRAAREGGNYVSPMARREIERLEGCRHWIEAPRLQSAA